MCLCKGIPLGTCRAAPLNALDALKRSVTTLSENHFRRMRQGTEQIIQTDLQTDSLV